MRPIKANCIEKNVIRERMVNVLDTVDNIVCKTLGPCGHNVLVQSADSVFMTKDGWTVMNNITMDNVLDNSIKSLIESCCQSVVLKAGDGTTTVTKAANTLNKLLLEHYSEGVTIRDIQNALESAVKNIADTIRKNSIKVTKDNMYDAIKNVALVSTNWDEKTSNIIASIYEETNNTIIKVENGGTEETTYRIINGYELNGDLHLPDFYLTDKSRGVCEIENPTIMLFDFKLMDKYFIPLFAISEVMKTKNKTLVVVAPDFDRTLIKRIESANIGASNNGLSLINIVPMTIIDNFNIDHDCLSDFTVLTGCLPITRHNEDVEEFLDDMTRCAGLDKTNEEPLSNEEKHNLISSGLQFMDSICGTCDLLTYHERHIVVSGLSKANNELVNERISKIEYEIQNKIKECDALTILTDDIRQKRIRLAKLKCNIGVISVGGHGNADLRARKDALDDAIRACEEAYYNGYNIGSSLSIISACEEQLYDLKISTLSGDIFNDVYIFIRDSFKEVFMTLVKNKLAVDVEERCNTIIQKCVDDNIGFDIISGTYDDELKIVNPTSVDVEVLNACLRLALTCNTSDQFLFNSHMCWDVIDDTNEHEPIEPDIDKITTNIINTVVK